MYIGILNAAASGLPVRTQYFRRGTKTELPRDKTDAAGRLAGWNWDTVMTVGVDIQVELGRRCFVGALCLTLDEGAAVEAVEVYAQEAERLRCVGRFDAQTGGLLTGALTVPVGAEAETLVVRLRAALKDIVLTEFSLVGAVEEGALVYPSPASAEYGPDCLPLAVLGAVEADPDCPDAVFAAAYARERFRERFGPSLSGGGGLALRLTVDTALAPDAYRLTVDADGVCILGGSRRALLYGVETLVQLVQDGKIPHAVIDDAPYREMRGFHMGLPPREELVFAKRLLKYVLIPLRYNQLILEFAGGMRFDSQPEISEAWLRGNAAGRAGTQPPFPHGEMVAGGGLLSKDEVRDFVAYAKSLGLEVIPEVQSLGHTQYITYAHPDIGEFDPAGEEKRLDTRLADQPPAEFYHHTYCPENEKSYTIIYNIIDEIIEVVRPERYVHMGHDEVYQMGLCPRCKGKNHAELLHKHITRMHAFLQKKGLKMMIWADMLHPTERYKTYPAVKTLPKDILLLDFIWYFHFDIDMEDHLLPYGYQVIMGNMYSSHYPRFERRMAKPGMVGGQVSSWCRVDEYTLGKKGKIFDLYYSAEMFWNPCYSEQAREVYNRVIAAFIPRLRDELRGIAKPVGAPVESVPVALPRPAACLDAPIAALLPGPKAVLDGRRFDFTGAQALTRPVEAAVGGKYQKLVFLHASADNAERVAWKPLTQIGRYTVTYADGSAVEIPVEYAGNIAEQTRRYAKPLPQQYYRHQGYIATYFGDPLLQGHSGCGRDLCALGFEWQNPHPDREIASIRCEETCDTGAGILLLAVTAVR